MNKKIVPFVMCLVVSIILLSNIGLAGSILNNNHLELRNEYQNRPIEKIGQFKSLGNITFTEPILATILFRDIVENNVSQTFMLTTYCAIPPGLPPRQQILDISYAPGGYTTGSDNWGQDYTQWIRPIVFPNIIVETNYTVKVRLYNITYNVNWENVTNYIPDSINDSGYLNDDEMYDITNPIIVDAVADAIGGQNHQYWKAWMIHNYVIDNLDYDDDGIWDDAPTVLQRGDGSCSEYSYVYIAMCRCAGIPARYVGGTVCASDYQTPDNDTTFHRWTQIYLHPYGWLPVDSNWCDLAGNDSKYFLRNSNRLLETTIGGGNSNVFYWGYNWRDNTDPGYKINITRIATWLECKKEWPHIVEPIGPYIGTATIDQNYEVSTMHDLYPPEYYLFDWGDGTSTGWLGPYNLGERCNAIHAWKSSGIYEVRVKAKNRMNFECDWADPLDVYIVKSRFLEGIVQFLFNIMERFPRIEPLLMTVVEFICSL